MALGNAAVQFEFFYLKKGVLLLANPSLLNGSYLGGVNGTAAMPYILDNDWGVSVEPSNMVPGSEIFLTQTERVDSTLSPGPTPAESMFCQPFSGE